MNILEAAGFIISANSHRVLAQCNLLCAVRGAEARLRTIDHVQYLCSNILALQGDGDGEGGCCRHALASIKFSIKFNSKEPFWISINAL